MLLKKNIMRIKKVEMSSIAVSVVLGSIGIMSSSYYYLYYYTTQNENEIENITSIKHVVSYLKKVSNMKETDDLIDHILVVLDKYPLSDECLQRLSRLHMQYGDGYGMNSYAINLLWSTVLFSYTTDTTKIKS